MGLEPSQPLNRWILTEVFRMSEGLIKDMTKYVPEREMVFWLQANLGMLDSDDPANKYLNSWNSARSDLIADLVPSPPELISTAANISPLLGPGDVEPALWMLVYLYGFEDKEITVMCPDFRWTPSDVRVLMPLLMCMYRRLREMVVIRETYKAKDEHQQLLFHYHRTKYLVLRYYLDAVYHQINQ